MSSFAQLWPDDIAEAKYHRSHSDQHQRKSLFSNSMKSERERKSDVQKIGRSGAIMRKNQYIQTGQERVCVRVCVCACVRVYERDKD